MAANLDVAHPPGFALYTILAHLMTRLPWTASPAYKVNLLSALISSVTLVVIYLSIYRLTRQPPGGPNGRSGTRHSYYLLGTSHHSQHPQPNRPLHRPYPLLAHTI